MTKDCISESSIDAYIERNFSEKRKTHTYAVRDTAVKLADFYGEEEKKAATAALFHDMFRGVSAQALNYYVKELNLPNKYKDNPNLAHGKIAAVIMKKNWGISDEDILNAVKYHTTGRAGMSKLEKIIYLAHAIEPGRNYPGVEDLRALAYEGLSNACLASLKHSKEYIESQKLYMDPDTELAIQDLEKRKETIR